ncbi:hypothetical protein D3C76_1050710 [compost metagenome]
MSAPPSISCLLVTDEIPDIGVDIIVITPAGTIPFLPGITARIAADPSPLSSSVTDAKVSYSIDASPVTSSAGVATIEPVGTVFPGVPLNVTCPVAATAARRATPCSAVRRSKYAPKVVLANPRSKICCAQVAASDSIKAAGAWESQIKEPSDLSISTGTRFSIRCIISSSVCSSKKIGKSDIIPIHLLLK